MEVFMLRKLFKDCLSTLRLHSKLLAFACFVLMSIPVFSQTDFQKIAGNGYYRFLGYLRNPTGREAYLSQLNFARNSFPGAEYKNIVTGKVEFIANVINVSNSLTGIMSDVIQKRQAAEYEKDPYYRGAPVYEFIFPFNQNGRNCYTVVVVTLQETWTTFDWARAWNIYMEY
jgi:hypothetical protein